LLASREAKSEEVQLGQVAIFCRVSTDDDLERPEETKTQRTPLSLTHSDG
jgi:hypothetical protein